MTSERPQDQHHPVVVTQRSAEGLTVGCGLLMPSLRSRAPCFSLISTS
jgi:hypothetical protein